MSSTDLLRFRIWVDGQLRCTHWVSATHPAAAQQAQAVAQHQRRIAAAADDAGQPWCAEVWDPDAPTDRAYLRFGTDRRPMHDPVMLVDAGQLAALLHDL